MKTIASTATLTTPTAPTLLALLVAGTLVAGAASAQRPPLPRDDNVNFAYADVLHVDPVYEVVRYADPVEECYDEPVTYRDPGERSHGGAVLGAIIGGVLGSNVGSGSGRRAATVAGAVAGGAVGANEDRRRAEPDRYYQGRERRCRLVDVPREERRIAGYDVEYQYKGDVYMSRLPYDPGSKLRVRVSVTPAD